MDGLLNRPKGHRPKLKIEQQQHLKVLLYIKEMQKAYKESNAKKKKST